jgi:hypothetical protein
MRARWRQSGQASAELVAVVPLVVVLTLAVAQLALAGWALWSAGSAARAGARASHVGGDAGAAARSALPSPLRDRARVSDGGPVEVRVAAPSLVPGLPSVPVTARADLPAGGG